MYIGQNYYSLFPQLQKIIQLYKEIEKITSSVKYLFSVNCPYGCGQCCNTGSHNIEASIIEMLPLCVYLYENNSYQFWINKACNNLCPFYEAETLYNNTGRCAVYEYRPLVCRLFGFSFMKNKYGAIVPVTCPTLQKQFTAQKNTTAVTPEMLPLMSTFSLQSIMIDPAIGTNRYPIDEAFRKAMNYVIYKMELYHQSTMTDMDRTA
ncbi:MAG: YkgJ family cysteine cluster protein [Spirochaetota bacterium]